MPAARLSRAEFIALVAALMALNALAIDVLLPALPAIGEALGMADANQRQLVIGAYMLGFGAGQLGIGPVSDRFGRRAPLLIGICFYVAAAFAAIAARDFSTLLLLRFLQGLGAAGTRIIAVSIVRDCYGGRAMAEILSLAFMVFMAIPILAPGIGQTILLLLPWQFLFVFMGGLAAAVGLWTLLRLPETLAPENRRPLTAASVIGGFALVLGNRSALAYGAAGIFLFGAILGFISTSQQIYVGIYGLGVWFPLAFGSMAGLMSLSAYLNSRMVLRYGMRRMSHFAILAHILFSGALLGLSLVTAVPLWLFFALIALTMFMFGWSSSNMNALSMEPLAAVAGTASSVFGFMQTVGGAVIGIFIGQHFDGTITPVAAGYLATGIGALACCLIAENGRLFGTGALAPAIKPGEAASV